MMTPSDRYYQLEEMEDNENSTTEIYLNASGSVDLPRLDQTNGPVPISASGFWKAGPADDANGFEMVVEREFSTGAGMEAGGSFKVKRIMKGAWETVGESISITGKMILSDSITGDIEVGYFSIIDTTDALKEIMVRSDNK